MSTMINERGTQDLIGETIVMVDTSSINVIHLHCASGKVVSIDGEEQHYGIPIIAVNNWKD